MKKFPSKSIILALMIGTINLSAFADIATSDTSVTFSGALHMNVANVNNGTSPLYGSGTADNTTFNDVVSHLDVSGRRNLFGGMYAGFELSSFFQADTGAMSNQTANTFFDGRALAKLGGNFGEVYFGREYSPIFYAAVGTDPWFWDTSSEQVGYIQFANYWNTSGVRTNKTIGFKSKEFNGLTFNLAYANGEKTNPNDVGASVGYSSGNLALGAAIDQHNNVDGINKDSLSVLTAAYDFGSFRPMLLVSSSKVAGVSYSAYSIAATAPLGSGKLKAAYSHINDWNTATAVSEGLNKVSMGYQYDLDSKTYLSAAIVTSTGDTATTTNAITFGINVSF